MQRISSLSIMMASTSSPVASLVSRASLRVVSSRVAASALQRRGVASTAVAGKKERIVILGTGWAAFRMVRSLSSNDFDVVVVSPRNHFLFTPLLPSTASGTLSFRSIIEPIRSSHYMKKVTYYQAKARAIKQDESAIVCEGVLDDRVFELKYDKLVIAIGASNNTFNIPGVTENAIFMKELAHARRVRTRIVELFERVSIPSTTTEERKKLLHFVVVGGGPTGVEFAAELSDFFWQDLQKSFPNVPINDVRITLVEAGHRILGAFDRSLVDSAMKRIIKQGIELRTDSVVQEVTSEAVILKSGESIPYGLLVWSTGVGPRKLTRDATLAKDPRGDHFLVNDHLRVVGTSNIYALGDCASIQGNPLQATAQVAQQQGAYLAKALNSYAAGAKEEQVKPFRYQFLGLMTYIGGYHSLIQTSSIKAEGLVTWVAWRSAYLTRLGTLRNKFQVPFDWFRTFVFGRDVTNF